MDTFDDILLQMFFFSFKRWLQPFNELRDKYIALERLLYISAAGWDVSITEIIDNVALESFETMAVFELSSINMLFRIGLIVCVELS